MTSFINLRVPVEQFVLIPEMTPFLLIFKDGQVQAGDVSEYGRLIVAEMTNNEGLVLDDAGTGQDYTLVACVRSVKYKDLPKQMRKILGPFGNPKPGQREDSPSGLFKWIGLQEVKGFWAMFTDTPAGELARTFSALKKASPSPRSPEAANG